MCSHQNGPLHPISSEIAPEDTHKPICRQSDRGKGREIEKEAGRTLQGILGADYMDKEKDGLKNMTRETETVKQKDGTQAHGDDKAVTI